MAARTATMVVAVESLSSQHLGPRHYAAESKRPGMAVLCCSGRSVWLAHVTSYAPGTAVVDCKACVKAEARGRIVRSEPHPEA
jgi:hypothetical protein